MNQVTLIGNVGRDPEIRYMQDGTAVANVSIATSEKWTSKSGEKKEHVDWHRCEAWGKTAELFRNHVGKGDKIAVIGKIRYEKWTDKDGNEKYGTKIRLDRLEFITSKKDSSAGSDPAAPAEEGSQGSFQATDDDVPF